jgi:hypothetical protein
MDATNLAELYRRRWSTGNASRVYRLTPRQAEVLLTVAPGGATRWRF